MESYWIRFRRPHDSDETVGKWVVFFRRNFANATDSERERWIQRFRSVVDASRVDEAILRKVSLDVGAFFTSADREEMSRVGEVLRAELSFGTATTLGVRTLKRTAIGNRMLARYGFSTESKRDMRAAARC